MVNQPNEPTPEALATNLNVVRPLYEVTHTTESKARPESQQMLPDLYFDTV